MQETIQSNRGSARTTVTVLLLVVGYLFVAGLAAGDMIRLEEWGYKYWGGGHSTPINEVIGISAILWPAYFMFRIGIFVMTGMG